MGLVTERSVTNYLEQKRLDAIRAAKRVERQVRAAAAQAARSGAKVVQDVQQRIEREAGVYRQQVRQALPTVTKALVTQAGLQGLAPVIGAIAYPKETARAVVDSARQGAGAVRAGARGFEDEILQGQANELRAGYRTLTGQGGDASMRERYASNLRREEALDARDRLEHPQARLRGRDVAATGRFAGHAAALAAGVNPQIHLKEMDQLLRNREVEHPDLLPSLVPFAGSAQEAVADYQDGDYLGAAGNAALAVSDALLFGTIVKTAGKAGYKFGGKALSPTWQNVRARMATRGHIGKGQHGHHAIIPNGRWGKRVPEVIRNSPLNIVFPRDISTHKRLHGRDLKLGLPKFNPLDRVRYGTPPWVAYALGHHALEGGMTLKRHTDPDD